jgi:hypothetical protein
VARATLFVISQRLQHQTVPANPAWNGAFSRLALGEV